VTTYIEEAGFRQLLILAVAGAIIGVLAGLLELFTFAFVVIVTPLALVSYRSTRAACVLVALSAPLVSLGSVDVGFELLPSYPFVGAGLVGALRRAEWRGMQHSPADALLLGFIGVAAMVSLANLGYNPATTVVDSVGVNARDVRSVAQSAALAAMGALYLLIRLGVRTEEDLAAVVRALLVAAVFVGVYAAYQVLGQQLDLPYSYVNTRRPASALPDDGFYIRVNSTLTEASTLAQFMLIPLLLGVAWLAGGHRNPAWMTRRLATVTAVGGAAVVFATLSKSGLGALALLAPLTVALAWPRRGGLARRKLALPFVALALLLGAFVARSAVLPGSLDQLVAGERYVRVGYWLAAVDIIEARPGGIGVGNFAFHYPNYASFEGKYEFEASIADAHNLFLEAAVETGVIGGFLLLGFAGAILLHGGRASRGPGSGWRRATAAGLTAAAAGGFLLHMTYSFFYFPFEWVVIALVAGLPYLSERAGP